MHKDSFDFVYNAEGDYYDLVVDKKIQKVVEELKALPHDVLIRYLTYWSEAIDNRKYVVDGNSHCGVILGIQCFLVVLMVVSALLLFSRIIYTEVSQVNICQLAPLFPR